MKRFLTRIKQCFKAVLLFIYSKVDLQLPELSKGEYTMLYIKDKSSDEIQKMHGIALSSRNIAIENYWKRANYYWAFQIASFTGYFAVSGSRMYGESPQILYFVVCIGFLTSLAWLLTNIGSRASQKHWEIHSDMLEDYVTGPLNKTRISADGVSITKINEIVSGFIVPIWFMLSIKYLNEHITFIKYTEVDFQVLFSTIVTIYFSIAMRFGYGRINLKTAQWKLYRR